MSLEQATWSWTEHLRGGGSTPWAEWVAAGSPGTTAVPPGWRAPGAAQLELLRRLASRRRPDADPTAFATLADMVLGRSAPGRGMAPAPLAWPGAEGTGHRLGAPATDPADLPDRELVRVAVGTLTELLVRPGHRAAPRGPVRSPRRRPWSAAFELTGPPVTRGAVATALAAHGRAPGGHARRVLLLAEPLDVALAQVWSDRVQRGAAVRWRGFVDRWAGRQELPRLVDYPALARTWADRVGPGRVHVLVVPSAADALAVLGASPRRRLRPVPSAVPRSLSVEALDVVRRVNAVLAVRLREDEHAAAAGLLCDAVVGIDRDTAATDPVATDPVAMDPVATASAGLPATYRVRAPRLTVPDRHRDWIAGQAARAAAELARGGYRVHGDTARLLPAPAGAPNGPGDGPRLADVLALAVDLCARMAGTGPTPVSTPVSAPAGSPGGSANGPSQESACGTSTERRDDGG